MKLFASLFSLVLVLSMVGEVYAVPPAQFTICHATGSGNYNKLLLPSQATGGHFDAAGNPQHGGDLLFVGNVECPAVVASSVPEFGTITAMMGMVVATMGFWWMRKENWV